MSFLDTLEKAEKFEEKDQSGDKLCLVLMGPSGAGKSYSFGTLGVKTLLLYFSGEHHGVKAARKEGGENIKAIPVDINLDTGKKLSPDETLANLRQILGSPIELKEAGFEAIILDGISELDLCIGQTKEMKKQCVSKNGKIDGFKTPGVTKAIGTGIINKMFEAQRVAGLHVLTTCILDVVLNDAGEYIEGTPRVSTFGFAEGILQMFGDRVVVSPRTKEDGEVIRVFDRMEGITRDSKTETGIVKKTAVFTPRLMSGDLPKLMKANLAELYKIKQGE